MYEITDSDWRAIMVALREPKSVSELPFPKAAYEFGQPNPHIIEGVKRRIATMVEKGSMEYVIEEQSNLTGSKTKRVFGGRYKLTPSGIQILRALNEQLEKTL